MSLSIGIKPGYVASGWAWHSRPEIVRTGKSMARACGWACPPWRVTFDPSHVLPWAWQEVEREAVSVNEVDYHCWNLLAAGPTGGRRGRGVGVVVWRMCCPAHTGKKVSCGVGGVVQWP